MLPELMVTSSELEPTAKEAILALTQRTKLATPPAPLSDQSLTLVATAPAPTAPIQVPEDASIIRIPTQFSGPSAANRETVHRAETLSEPKPTTLFSLASDATNTLRGLGILDLSLDPPVAEIVIDPTVLDPTGWAQVLFDELALNCLRIRKLNYQAQASELQATPDPQVESTTTTSRAAATSTGQIALAVWDHGANTPIGILAQANGWSIQRSLVIMTTELTGRLPTRELPPGWQIRTFDRTIDEPGWLELNQAAFTDLPDQGSWGLSDLRARYTEPWFDSNDFLVLTDSQGAVRGTHWTKRSGLLGEIYVLAVAPDLTGKGLGTALTNAGLNQLFANGATAVQLYVDASNHSALQVYRNTGFVELARDTQYLALLGHA